MTDLQVHDDGANRLQLPDRAAEVLERIEHDDRLDPLVEKLEGVADAVAGSEVADDLLTGAWLGHALHPLMTDLPIGAWTSASLLDVLGGKRSRRAAAGLMAFGIVTAAPTIATGLAELRHIDPASRRVAGVHAATNSCALALYTASLFARRRHHGRAVLLGLAGATVASVGGYLGGHLTVARKVGTRDERFSDEAPSTAIAV